MKILLLTEPNTADTTLGECYFEGAGGLLGAQADEDLHEVEGALVDPFSD